MRVNPGVAARTRGPIATVLAAIAAALVFVTAASAAPANDDFANAETITGLSGVANGSTAGATKEAGEPNHADFPGGASVWYRWTAPASGRATFETCGSGFDTLLAVYMGSALSALAPVASNDQGKCFGGSSSDQSSVAFLVTAGTVYSVAIDGFGTAAQGATSLYWNLTPPPANDEFGDAETIGGHTGSLTGTTVGATKQMGEPNHAGLAGGASVWYGWTAPASGRVSFETCGSTFDTVLAVYTGSAPGALTPIAANDDASCPGSSNRSRLVLTATAGITYWIAIDGFLSAQGAVGLAWKLPSNDDLASAETIAGRSGTTSSSNVLATKETGEPDHAGNAGGASIWYRWTAPATGPVRFDTCGSGFDTLLALYTGNSVGALASVASNDDGSCGGLPSLQSTLTFTAVSGTVYRIAVDGVGSAQDAANLAWAFVPPPRDVFADAETIVGLTGAAAGTTVGATKEAGEPNHAGFAGGASVWYGWTAPASGRVSFETCGSSFDTLLAVYTGSTVDALTPIAFNDDATCPGTSSRSRLALTAMEGRTYWIAIDGFNAAAGTTTLTWRLPGNDDFASAETIAGLSGTVSGSNLLSTREAGEPDHAGNAGGASIWYRWTAPASGTARFDTCGNSFTTLLAVYTGTLVDTLTPVASSSDGTCEGPASAQSTLSFTATAGITYRIAVDGDSGATGGVQLTWSSGNDNFADAVVLEGLTGTATGSNVGATKQAGEPDHAGNVGGKSIWYSWTAPAIGRVIFNTCSSSFNTLLAVYTGGAVDELAAVASNDQGRCGSAGSVTSQSSVAFTATAGTRYLIAVDGAGGAQGTTRLAWSPAPANDDVANAQAISGVSGTVSGSTLGATKEAGELDHAGVGGEASIWYRWTAPATALARFDTCGSGFDTLLAVYAESATGPLTPVASNDNSRCPSGVPTRSRVTFTATAGDVYLIALDGAGGAQGTTRLNWNPPPANDDFANAEVIAAPSGSVNGSTVAATKESNEPAHARSFGGASIWYRWTAPARGRASFDTCGTSFDTVLAVYTGSVIDALTPVVANDDGTCPGNFSRQSSLAFMATTGAVYWIAIDGFGSAAGSTTLTWSLILPPGNDDFANAETIAGGSGTVSGSNVLATKEAGEPDHAGNRGGASIWYRWTAPASGRIYFHTCAGTEFESLLAIYTGGAWGELTQVAAGASWCSVATFLAEAGTVYWIAVDGLYGGQGTTSLSWTPPPANDDFANAEAIAGFSGAVSGSNFLAAKEPGEPDHAGNVGGKSIWYRWTAPASGEVSFDTCGSGFDTLLAVYTGGTLGAAAPVASNDQGSCGVAADQSSLTFQAAAGTAYAIAIDGSSGNYGAARLRWSFLPPANDSFASGESTAGLSGTASGTTAGATKEAGEPDHAGFAGGASIWYRWTAPASGRVTFETCGSGFDTLLAVYTGNAVGALTPVVANDDSLCGEAPSAQSRLTFTATAGTLYTLAIDGAGGNRGDTTLAWAFVRPQNDDFANAQTIQGSSGSAGGSTVGATKEAGEYDHAGDAGGVSIWYRWTAPASAFVRFDTCGSSFDTLLAVYAGGELSTLTSVASNNDGVCGGAAASQSSVTFPATAGTVYWIAIDGTGGALGPTRLTWSVPPPQNDDFANAETIEGLSGTASGTTVGATKQAGEPNHAGFAGGASIWYRWTAPASGRVTFETCGSTFDTLLAVYTGNAVAALTSVVANDDGCSLRSRVSFMAIEATVYWMAIDGFGSGRGTTQLAWSPPPANDDFANAATIDGFSGSATGTTVGATKQPGEPGHASTGGASIWYAWTAPANGLARFDTCGSSFDTLLAVYTGSAVGSLTRIASNNDSACPGSNRQSRVSFPATTGTVYRIAIDGLSGTTGSAALAWTLIPVPTEPAFTGSDPRSPANANTPTISGSADAGTTVRLHTNATCADAAVATGTAADFASPGLPVDVADDSTTTFYATATNEAGTSPCSAASITYVEDSTAPAVTLAELSSPTNDVTPSFSGTAEPGAGNVTLSIWAGSDTSGAALKTYDLAVAGDGSFTHTVSPAEALADGDYTARASQTDAAGNTGQSLDRAFAVDATPPSLSIDSKPSDPTAEKTPAFHFSSLDPTAAFECSFTPAANAPSFTPCSSPQSYGPLAEGRYTFTVTAADAVGNANTQSHTFSVRGNLIAFASTRDGNSEIYVMKSDGSAVTRLTNHSATDTTPVWSTDRTRIAFSSNRDGDLEIYVMNADGSGVTQLTNNPAADSTPAWSPAGTAIAFTSTRDGNLEIYSLNPSTTGVTRLTNNRAVDTTPTWSPDGGKIAFSSTRDGNYELYSMDAGGTGLARLTANGAADSTPSWSPDGAKIAFSSTRNGNLELYALKLADASVARLTTNSAIDTTPSWSPDGTKIAFSSTRDGNSEIYSLDSTTLGVTRLTTNPALDALPAW